MADLPRSNALVAFDINGFLLPIEPVTPPDSKVWRSIHFSPVLIAIGIGLFLLATFAGSLATMLLGHVGLGGRGFYSIPLIGTAIVVASYHLFVRVVERRRDLAELGLAGWWRDVGAGLGGGVLLILAVITIIRLAGAGRVTGIEPLGLVLPSLVLAGCSAVVQEFIMRGEVFRLLERLTGSWIALAVTATGLGMLALTHDSATLRAGIAGAMANGVLFSAAFMATRRLWMPIALHIAWNATGLLLSLELTGSARLTGGQSGPLTSWPAIVVAALASAGLLLLAVRRSRVVAPAWTRDVAKAGGPRRAVGLG